MQEKGMYKERYAFKLISLCCPWLGLKWKAVGNSALLGAYSSSHRHNSL